MTLAPANVCVKALEWVEGAPGTYTEIAESPFGHYSVWEINGTACWSPWKAGSGSIVDGGLEGAKAAAQADFASRIMSALSDQPAAAVVGEPVAWLAAHKVDPKRLWLATPNEPEDRYWSAAFPVYRAAPSASEGRKLVPIVPTTEMHEAAWGASLCPDEPMHRDFVEINERVFRAMIAAYKDPPVISPPYTFHSSPDGMREALEKIAAMRWHEDADLDDICTIADRALAAPSAPDGWQEAAHIGDAVLTWMVKYDLLDAGNEYRAEDVVAVLNDFAPDPFPQPIRKDGGDPCGECHIQPGETCDICGAKARNYTCTCGYDDVVRNDAILECIAVVGENFNRGIGDVERRLRALLNEVTQHG